MNADGKKKGFRAKTKVTPNPVKPVGEWNTMEITARGTTLSLWVNGVTTVVFRDCHVKDGYIGLEGEGYRIEFRNLKVKELMPGANKQ